MKGSVRGVDFQRDGADEDPFAELADIFESEVGRAAFRAPLPAGRATHQTSATPVDHDFTADFEGVFEAEMAGDSRRAASAPTDMSYQNWLSPRGARQPPMPATGRHGDRLTGVSSGEADFETAIRGLSAPANPRHSAVFETQSFAPERVVDDYRHAPAPREIDDFDALIASELAAMHHLPSHHAMAAPSMAHADRDYAGHGASPVAFDGRYDSDGYEMEGDDGEEEAPAHAGFLSRHTRLLAGGVVSLALVGAVGFFTFGSGSSEIGLAASGEPLLIKADAEPYKIMPENPGGRSIPNQNKAVYERVASPDAGMSTTQSALLTQSEEPIDLPAEDEPAAYEDLPGVDLVDNEGLGLKDSARLDEVAAATMDDASPVPVLQPRKVRTMVVRPDGTIVESAPAASQSLLTAAAQPLPPTSAAVAPPPAAEMAQAAPAAADSPTQQPASPASVPYSAALVAEERAVTLPEVQPSSAELPSDPMQVAAIATAPEAPVVAEPPAAQAATPPAGSYFVQISSQPSEALAQQSLQSLGSRYANLIEGRSLGIQPADIPGKGTFYRVRVATASRDEAATLCTRLKSAGGNCFVAR